MLWRETAPVTLLFLLLSYFLYWPVFTHPSRDVFLPFSAHLIVDVELILWILSTVAENLSSHPWDLFAGQTFHPDLQPIARSEHLLSQQLSFAPVYLTTGNPILALQTTLLFNVTMCGVAMYLLLRHWGVSILASLFGAFVYATFPARYFAVHAPHVSAVQYLPLALLFLDRSLTFGRGRDACLFGVFFALQMLTSFYLAYVSIFFVGAYILGVLSGRGLPPLRNAAVVLVGGGLAGVVLLVVAMPYFELAASGDLQGISKRGIVLMSNLSWASYLYPPIAVRNWKWLRFGLEYYVGIVPLLFALVGIVAGLRAKRGPSVVGLLLAMLVAYLLAMGPSSNPDAIFWGKPFETMARWLPGFSSIRAPGRFGLGVLVGVAALAGLGLDVLLRALGRNAGLVLTSALALLVAVEFGLFHFRFRAQEMPVLETIPRVYHALRELEPGTLLELPGGWLESNSHGRLEARYSYLSIFHRHDVLNGYTGYRPDSYRLVMAVARALPEPRAIDLLRRLTGLRYVVVHRASLTAPDLKLWKEQESVKLIGTYGTDDLFEVAPGNADLLERLVGDRDGATTVLGVLTDPLPVAAMRAEIRLVDEENGLLREGAKLSRRIGSARLRVTARNRGDRTWPVLVLDSSKAVGWYWYWQPVGETEKRVGQLGRRMGYDLGPGETSSTSLIVALPKPGMYDLVVGLRQGMREFPDPLRIERVEVVANQQRPKTARRRVDGRVHFGS